MGRLSGDARLDSGDLLLGGTRLDSGDRRGEGARRVRDGTDLVDGDIVQTARDVAASDLDQRIEHAGAQVRCVPRQRISQPHRPPARVVGGQAERVVHVADEGVGQHLGETGPRQSPHRVAAGALTRRQSRPRRGERHGRGDVVVAVETGDLLGGVRRADEIGTPRGRGDGEQLVALAIGAGGLDGAADRLQQLGDPPGTVGDAGQTLRGVSPDDEGGRGDGPVDVGGGRIGDAAAVLDKQVDGPLGGDGSERGVHPALVALGGLGGQLVASCGTSDGHGVEVGGLDEDVSGALVDLGVGAAEDPGEHEGARALGVGRVRDDEILGIQGTGDVVEERESLVLASPAHDDRLVQLV